MNHLARSIFFIPLEAMGSFRQLLRENFLGVREMLYAVLHPPVAMIHRGQVHENLQFCFLHRPIDGRTGDTIMPCEFGDGIAVDPPPVEFPSHLRQEFGIFMHERLGKISTFGLSLKANSCPSLSFVQKRTNATGLYTKT